MIESRSGTGPAGSADDAAEVASTALSMLVELERRLTTELARARDAVTAASEPHLGQGAGEVEVISVCETLVRIAQGHQHDAVSSLQARREAADPAPSPARRAARERSLRSEVGMARGVGNGAGQHHLDVAAALRDHPCAHALLRDGLISAAVAAALVAETVTLDRVRRARVDELVATSLPGATPREASAIARRHVLALDPGGAEARARAARATRHVRLRRRPDAMAELVVRGSAEQVVAAWRRLGRDATLTRSRGDCPVSGGAATADVASAGVPTADRAEPATAQQLMSDLALEALSGIPVAADGNAPTAPVEVGLLMRPEVLFGTEDSPAVLEGYGPIPAALARRLAGNDTSWLRRLFTDDRGDPVDCDPRRRRFPERIARLVRATDGHCLRPYCDCDVTDIDHTRAHARGGTTTQDNGAGTCRHDNILKEGRGWRVRTSAPQVGEGSVPQRIAWSTPTGHTYVADRRHSDSRGPTLIAIRRPRAELTPLEEHLHDQITRHRPRRQ
ncbi:hypothetical protein CLV56_3348 [Mumia flava]|uniref:DUF222 domain-containing protein n=1 Tax=Mumia flava TaxID=1348852 RepID=A0A2M9B7C9_9ACTN|nr:HNH endonuclease signature motif containing protein [Mumia flava]PJJ53848.1 hypothetical protein CLV56_3348 [Mumia flava]